MGGKFPVAATALLVTVLVAGCVSERDFDPIASADWKPGYTFHYEVEVHSTVSGSFTIDGVPQDEMIDEASEDFGPAPLYSYTVFNTQAMDGGTPLYLALVSAEDPQGQMKADRPLQTIVSDRPEVIAFSQAELQPLRTTAYMSREATLSVSSPDMHPFLRFPLKQGDAWSDQGQQNSMFGRAITEAAVGGLVSVDGPNGDVDAVHIRHDTSIQDKEAIREEIMAEARQENVDVNSFDFDQSGHTDVYYAPSLHNIVRQESTVSMYLQADAVQDGKRMVIDVSEEQTTTITLVAVSLAEGPERTLAEALDGSITLPPIPDPPVGGTTGPPGGESLQLAADRTVVNAAESPTVSFETKVTGAVSGLRYEVVDGAGVTVARGSGGDFGLDIDEPGTYTATVTGSAGGRTLRSEATVLANYQATLPANCPTLAGDGVAACEEQPVPVRAGIASLTVSAVRTPRAMADPGSGELVLLDPSGDEVETVALANNAATITLPAPLEPGDWSVVYRPQYGVLEQVEYEIVLQHT